MVEAHVLQLLLHSRQGFDGGVTANFSENLALAQTIAFVDLQKLHGCFADGAGRVDLNAMQLKAFCPTLGTGMEQPGEFRTRPDERAQIAAFAVVTGGTGPREIRRFGGSTVFAVMMWSIWQPQKVSSSWMRQYSQTW